MPVNRTELMDVLLAEPQYKVLYSENDGFHDGVDLMVKLLPAWMANVASDAMAEESEKLRTVEQLVFGAVSESLLRIVQQTVEVPPAVLIEEVSERVFEVAGEVTEAIEENRAEQLVQQDPWLEPLPVFPAPRKRRQTVKGHTTKKAAAAPVKKTSAKKAAANKAPVKKTSAKRAAAKKTPARRRYR
jgi:hypothetical protein